MFDQILDISRFETGAIDVKSSAFPVAPMLERIQHEYASRFSEKGLKLRLFHTDAWLVTNPALLERVLRNYVENALHYTSCGGVLMGCRRRSDVLLIEVWDTGYGIPEADLHMIFDEFHRLNHPGNEAGIGAGLGLSIVKRISRILYLNISVRSRPGRGSVFSVAVPIGEPSMQEVAPYCKPDGGLKESLDGMHVWVVDDDPIALEGMEVLLESWGGICRSFGSPQQVTAFMHRHTACPDLIVSDYSLQDGITGGELIRSIRQQYGKPIAALLVTGSASVDGCFSDILLLRKPVDPSQLCEKILELIRDG